MKRSAAKQVKSPFLLWCRSSSGGGGDSLSQQTAPRVTTFFSLTSSSKSSVTIPRLKLVLFLIAMISLMCIISGIFFLPSGRLLVATPSLLLQDVRRHIPLTTAGRLACTSDAGCSLPAVSHLNFMVVGDIGGLPIFPYYSYAQTKVANSLSESARQYPLHFLINVGDNFYFNGVQNVKDDRFENSFEWIYDKPELMVPWYTIGGNHDHLGNMTAQMEHTNFSSKWTFPNLFYKIRISFDAGEEAENGRTPPVILEVLMLDTIVLCGNTVDIQGQSSLLSWMFATKCETDGPPPKYRELAKQQWDWIEHQLNTSKADYLFVVGHYPIYSTCEHGSFACLQRLDSLLHSSGANAYFSGHDHNLQHIQFENKAHRDQQGKHRMVHYIVSGAASRSDRSARHLDDVPEDALLFRYPTGWNPLSQIGFSNGGFVQVKLGRQGGKLSFYSGTNEEKYSFEMEPRRAEKTK